MILESFVLTPLSIYSTSPQTPKHARQKRSRQHACQYARQRTRCGCYRKAIRQLEKHQTPLAEGGAWRPLEKHRSWRRGRQRWCHARQEFVLMNSLTSLRKIADLFSPFSIHIFLKTANSFLSMANEVSERSCDSVGVFDFFIVVLPYLIMRWMIVHASLCRMRFICSSPLRPLVCHQAPSWYVIGKFCGHSICIIPFN